MIAEARTWPERCSGCGYHEATQGCACKGTLRFTPGVREKAEGIARAEAHADPSDRARIDAAIRTVAGRGGVFSANDVRPLIPNAHGPLVGARFNAAARAGVIVRIGYESSTKANTHAHPIATWQAAS